MISQDGHNAQGHRHAEGAQLVERRDHQLLYADDRREEQGRRLFDGIFIALYLKMGYI